MQKSGFLMSRLKCVSRVLKSKWIFIKIILGMNLRKGERTIGLILLLYNGLKSKDGTYRIPGAVEIIQ